VQSFESVSEYHEFRARTIGVRPLFNFVELGYNVKLPEHVWAHPLLAAFETTTIKLIGIHNDCLSYFKEQRDAKKAGRGKHVYNVLAVMRDIYGLECQDALDRAADMAGEMHERITAILGGLFALGDTLESSERAQLNKYMEGVLNCARANLWWSFRTKWYFGDKNDQVYGSGVVIKKEHE
jgi:hypothetical protein